MLLSVPFVVHCLSSYSLIDITHVMNIVVTSLSATANKYGLLTKEETPFSQLLCVLTCLRPKMALFSTKSVNLCRICTFLKLVLKVKVRFTLERATKAQRGSRGVALLLL